MLPELIVWSLIKFYTSGGVPVLKIHDILLQLLSSGLVHVLEHGLDVFAGASVLGFASQNTILDFVDLLLRFARLVELDAQLGDNLVFLVYLLLNKLLFFVD